MSTIKTYAVQYRKGAVTLSGDVTSHSKAQAIATAFAAWGITETGGDWSADQKPEQVQAELHARHAFMDETAGIAA